MSDFNMLGSLGVDVPYKVVKLSKPPSAFIEEAGGPLAQWEAARGRAGAGGANVPAAGSVSRTSSQRRGRVHAHPMQRSHFSAEHPASLAIDPDDAPLRAPIPNHAHHRRNARPKDAVCAPSEHPLEQHHFSKAHRNARTPLSTLQGNTMAAEGVPAAGAPSGRVTRQPVPSNVDAIHGEGKTAELRPATPRLAGPRMWTEERDRKLHDRQFHAAVAERRAQPQPQPQPDHVAGRERVLSATSPPRAGARSGYTAPQHALPHMHKRMYDDGDGGSPVGARPAIGKQKSTLQRAWLKEGWWAGGGADEVEPKLQYRAPSPGARQPSYAVPHYSKTLFEAPTEANLPVPAHTVHPPQHGRRPSPGPGVRRSSSVKSGHRWR